ncbi:MAG: serine protease [Solirubrobacteraceae bacterium]|nr:serine protease [Solirubrobacteraceae bacterium]
MTARRLLLAAALLVVAAQTSAFAAEPLVSQVGVGEISGSASNEWIVGGTRAPIADAPWQVDVWSESGRSSTDCGGAILDASTVLTAAHCVDGTNPGAPAREGGLAVWAGTSSIRRSTATIDDRIALQERSVSSARQHPGWRGRVGSTGDLAVLTLSEPLTLDGRRVAAISLPPAVPVPTDAPYEVPGNLTVTGYGRTSSGKEPDGWLRSVEVQVVDPDRCDDADNAAEICARAPRGSACSGDSGGPVTAAGIFLVGIVSNGPRSCPAGGPNRYVNLYAPENREFVLGSTAPPTAPRRLTRARFTGGSGDTPLVGSELTCDGGAFSGATTQRTLITTATGDTVLASTGRIAELAITADLFGARLRCRSYASNAGGVALSPLAVTGAAVRAPSAGRQCPAVPATATVRMQVVASARAGATVRVTGRLRDPSSAAGGVVLIVRAQRAGATSVRRTARLVGRSPSAVVRAAIRLPRGAKPGRRLRYQAVMVTYPTRGAARTANGLAGACDAGDATFGIRIKR